MAEFEAEIHVELLEGEEFLFRNDDFSWEGFGFRSGFCALESHVCYCVAQIA